MNNSKLSSATKILSRITEVILFIAAAVCLVITIICALVFNQNTIDMITSMVTDGTLMVSGFVIPQLESLSEIRSAAVLTCVGAFISCMLGALIFRNIVRVFNNTENTRTPFTSENVKLIRSIGHYAIATPFVGVVRDILIGIICHVSITAHVEITTLLMGMIVLCLSRFFEYGVTLEDDVKGMI